MPFIIGTSRLSSLTYSCKMLRFRRHVATICGRAGTRSQSCEVADGRKPTGLPAPDGLRRTAKRRSCSCAATMCQAGKPDVLGYAEF